MIRERKYLQTSKGNEESSRSDCKEFFVIGVENDLINESHPGSNMPARTALHQSTDDWSPKHKLSHCPGQIGSFKENLGKCGVEVNDRIRK